MANLIAVEHLYRYYGKHCAVNDVSFTLAKGEVLGFLGPNGAGKTTTMQMLCGNLAPSSGQIKINGFDLLDQPNKAKRSLGYLPDTPPLYKDLSVQEFLHYCAQLHGMAKNSIAYAINKAKERCGLADVSHRLIANLSKGFQQRVGIAQAILHNPEVIILDEPTVGLDPIQIREIRTLIRELGQDHGVILSTHILSEVQESCSHVQIIHQGQLILSESIAGLNQYYEYRHPSSHYPTDTGYKRFIGHSRRYFYRKDNGKIKSEFITELLTIPANTLPRPLLPPAGNCRNLRL